MKEMNLKQPNESSEAALSLFYLYFDHSLIVLCLLVERYQIPEKLIEI